MLHISKMEINPLTDNNIYMELTIKHYELTYRPIVQMQNTFHIKTNWPHNS